MKCFFAFLLLISIAGIYAMKPDVPNDQKEVYKDYYRAQLLASLDPVLRDHYENSNDKQDEDVSMIGRYIVRVSECAWQEYLSNKATKEEALKQAVAAVPRDAKEEYWLESGEVTDDVLCGTGEGPKGGKSYWDSICNDMRRNLLLKQSAQKYQRWCKTQLLNSLDPDLLVYYAQYPQDQKSQIIERYMQKVIENATRLNNGIAVDKGGFELARQSVPACDGEWNWILTGKKSRGASACLAMGLPYWERYCKEMKSELDLDIPTTNIQKHESRWGCHQQ